MERREVRLSLTPRPTAAGVARHALDELRELLTPELLATVQLLVSELVTNSYRHAGLAPHHRIGVGASLGAGRIRIEVTDPGPGFVPPRPPEPGDESGWGLYLVDRLADRWGVDDGDPTRVWAELELHSHAVTRATAG